MCSPSIAIRAFDLHHYAAVFTAVIDFDDDVNTIDFGLNYKFNWSGRRNAVKRRHCDAPVRQLTGIAVPSCQM